MTGVLFYNEKTIRWRVRIVEYSNARGRGEVQILYKDRKFQLIPHIISLYEDMSYEYLINKLDNEPKEDLERYIEGVIEAELKDIDKKKKWS